MSAASAWHVSASALGKPRALRLVAPELPGHGVSRATMAVEGAERCDAALSIERVARAVSLIASGDGSNHDASGGRRAIVGYSMGGRLALRVFTHHPEVRIAFLCEI